MAAILNFPLCIGLLNFLLGMMNVTWFDKTFRFNTRPVKSRVTYHCINDQCNLCNEKRMTKIMFVKSFNILFTATSWIGEPCLTHDFSSGDRLARLIKQFLTNVVRFDGHEKWACTTPTFKMKVTLFYKLNMWFCRYWALHIYINVHVFNTSPCIHTVTQLHLPWHKGTTV